MRNFQKFKFQTLTTAPAKGPGLCTLWVCKGLHGREGEESEMTGGD